MWNRLNSNPLNSNPLNRIPLNSSVIAHQIQIDQTVGATKHIEPNDNPRAGEPSVVWFALTQKGGASIPLSDCDCQLTVYAQDQTEPFATPELNPITAEGYEGIPSATVTFPAVGAYRLRLQGQPEAEQDFAAFELEFDVLVAQAARSSVNTPMAAPNSAAESNASVEPESPAEQANLSEPDAATPETLTSETLAPETLAPETLSATATTTEVIQQNRLPLGGVMSAVIVLVLLGVGTGTWVIRKRSKLK
ncbi:MAG: hypothetical protein AAGF24_16485 [Cyanobacteria bacterium P01_H01_bin.121]